MTTSYTEIDQKIRQLAEQSMPLFQIAKKLGLSAERVAIYSVIEKRRLSAARTKNKAE